MLIMNTIILTIFAFTEKCGSYYNLFLHIYTQYILNIILSDSIDKVKEFLYL